MSDSDESRVTHTEISSPFEGLSDIGSPRVVGPEHEGLPWMLDDPYVHVALQAPPSPDYIPGPEEPQSPPLPDFVPEPSIHACCSSHLCSVTSFVLEQSDHEEVNDVDHEEDPFDYPADGGDDSDDEDESSEFVALPAANQAPSAEEIEPFKTDESAATPPPHPAYRVTARISIQAPVPTPVWSGAEVVRLLAISTPPSSPLSPWSSPLPQIPSPPLPQIPSPPLPVSSPVPVLSPSPPASPIRPLGYRAAMIRLRAEAASTSHSLPLPPPIILSHTRPDAPSSGIPPLHLLSTDRREDRPEVTLPPRKRLGIALGPRYEIGESSSAAAARPAGGLRADYGFVATMDREIRRDLERDVGYGITDSWDEIVEAMQGTPVVTDVSGRHLLAGRLNMLFKDRRAHAQVMSLCTIVLAQQSQIRELQSADHGECKTRMAYDSTNSGNKGARRMSEPLVSTLTDFMKVPTSKFKDSKELSTLTQWIEKNGNLFRLISNILYMACCVVECFPEGNTDKIEKYVGGLPDMIHGSIVASKPKTVQEATEMAIEVMDKRIRTYTDRRTESKRKFEDTSRKTQN
ncbi:hypothetical protein Tco_1313343 [Tanacetum coccineum]